nr:immunoglobulin heavy chain junction region [Macaca mulatta]MOV48869.1 immunoglobulin heavy chain junction region [Macaca mulatta]MOV48923.1 immunoglobulin heavy chain junction region [Macaca mulatta]MOV48938.1 immunoglobulin heavy chain junction region [Macaca mulatta]MOV48959.1 immunoglobulin heavy chain junction region [Macaca mulatta]
CANGGTAWYGIDYW